MFTVAFDGKNFEDPATFDAIENSILLGAKVTGSCKVDVIGECGGHNIPGKCERPGETKWQCYEKKKAVCDYSHYVKADITVRVQEDGFTYGVWDDKSGKAVADTPKFVFRTVAGNGNGVIS
jgi:hypothetical protein